MFISLPYFGPQSERLRSELRKISAKTYIHIHFKIVLSNKHTIKFLFNFKDTFPTELDASLVYAFTCESCQASQYFGSTTRHFKVRLCEHRGMSSRTGRPLASPAFSSIRDHCTNSHNRLPKEIEFKVISRTKNLVKIRILESLYISKFKPKLNNMQSSFPLLLF